MGNIGDAGSAGEDEVMSGKTTVPHKRRYAPRMAPEQRREQLLDAALEVIIDDGVHKVSIDAVAKRAGVTRPVVYGHFDDSNALLRASLDREAARAMGQWFEALSAGRGCAPADAVHAVVAAFLDRVDQSPQLWRAAFMLSDTSTPQFRARLESGRDAAVQSLEDFLRDVITAPGRTVDAPVLARMWLAIMWEAGRLRLADPVAYPPERLVGMCDALFVPFTGETG